MKNKLGVSTRYQIVTLTLLMLFGSNTQVHAQSTTLSTVPSALPSEALIVGVYHAPPFVIEGDDGWGGISVHLWRDAAQELGVEYEWRLISPEQTVSSLADGSVDVVIGAVANSEDERTIDFSQSYFVSSIGMAEPAQRTMMEIAGAFFSPRFWQIAMWLAITFLLVGIVAWLFERKVNEEQFGQSAAQGIWAGFWWAGVTMSTIGYGDKSPKTVGGRTLALLWMLVAMGITATLTASLTSILAAGSGLGGTQFPSDLRSMKVGSVADTQSAQFLQDERIQFKAFETLQAGLEAVGDDGPAIFIGDVAMLRFVNNESMGGLLRISATGVHPQHHAFALPEESELREPLNRVILSRIEEPAWRSLIERYVPQK